MALAGWLILWFLGSEALASLLHQSHDRHGSSHHRNSWPSWHGSQYFHSRHNHEPQRGGRYESSLRNLLRGDGTTSTTSTTIRSPEPVLATATSRSFRSRENNEEGSRDSRHRVLHRLLEPIGETEKLTAVAVSEHGGTRAVAYAGYHDVYRNTQIEAFPAIYQPSTTPTATTYSRPQLG